MTSMKFIKWLHDLVLRIFIFFIFFLLVSFNLKNSLIN